VVAVPGTRLVQGHHEEIRGLRLLQQRLRTRGQTRWWVWAPRALCVIVGLEQRVTERTTEAIEDRSQEEKAPDCLRLSVENLSSQIVEHVAMAAGEGRNELGDIVAAPD